MFSSTNSIRNALTSNLGSHDPNARVAVIIRHVRMISHAFPRAQPKTGHESACRIDEMQIPQNARLRSLGGLATTC